MALIAAAGPASAGPVPVADGVLVYEPGPAPFKGYVKELRTPGGVQVLLDSPADHIHHHGLMLALGVDGVDFWTEAPPEKMGRQVPRGAAAFDASGVRQVLDWRAPGGTNLIAETRHVTVRAGAAGEPTWLTWESSLRTAGGRPAARLWGRHYFGLGFRFVRDFDGAVEFLFEPGATNRVVRGDERLAPSRWCAARGTIGGKPVTVAMFDHPSNPRHPAEWFTMSKPFAYLSATLGLEKAPMTVEAGRDLRLRWAVALWDGHPPPETIAEHARRWAATPGEGTK
ncbi:MAG: PmoA family protein [Verrucomicrobia bacterium]|nr:PmoA family protein [Verrucomicrobiota bacterium]